jgi:hypothetical protein
MARALPLTGVCFRRQFIHCGKPNCRKWHGPYWYAFYRSRAKRLGVERAGATTSAYVGSEEKLVDLLKQRERARIEDTVSHDEPEPPRFPKARGRARKKVERAPRSSSSTSGSSGAKSRIAVGMYVTPLTKGSRGPGRAKTGCVRETFTTSERKPRRRAWVAFADNDGPHDQPWDLDKLREATDDERAIAEAHEQIEQEGTRHALHKKASPATTRPAKPRMSDAKLWAKGYRPSSRTCTGCGDPILHKPGSGFEGYGRGRHFFHSQACEAVARGAEPAR